MLYDWSSPGLDAGPVEFIGLGFKVHRSGRVGFETVREASGSGGVSFEIAQVEICCFRVRSDLFLRSTGRRSIQSFEVKSSIQAPQITRFHTDRHHNGINVCKSMCTPAHACQYTPMPAQNRGSEAVHRNAQCTHSCALTLAGTRIRHALTFAGTRTSTMFCKLKAISPPALVTDC